MVIEYDDAVADMLVSLSRRARCGQVAVVVVAATLTEREGGVLALMAEGLTHGSIAGTPVVSEAAVRKPVGSIFARLPVGAGSDRRVAAVPAYLRG
jgi:DNA-binding NarL/FixJ family response regulator